MQLLQTHFITPCQSIGYQGYHEANSGWRAKRGLGNIFVLSGLKVVLVGMDGTVTLVFILDSYTVTILAFSQTFSPVNGNYCTEPSELSVSRK